MLLSLCVLGSTWLAGDHIPGHSGLEMGPSDCVLANRTRGTQGTPHPDLANETFLPPASVDVKTPSDLGESK